MSALDPDFIGGAVEHGPGTRPEGGGDVVGHVAFEVELAGGGRCGGGGCGGHVGWLCAGNTPAADTGTRAVESAGRARGSPSLGDGGPTVAIAF